MPSRPCSSIEGPSRRLLSTYGFVAALAVLMLNDLVLKWTVGGFVTGKLSDFAGLFVFALFWTAVLPRHRLPIHCLIAAVFIWWKLPVSEPLIALWNSWSILPVGRTVDPTDIIALSGIVGAWWFSSAPRSHIPLPGLRWAVVPVALFSFAATSFWSVQRYDRTYSFRASPDEVRRSLRMLGMQEWAEPDSMKTPRAAADGTGTVNLKIPAATGFTVNAALHIAADSAGSAVTLRELQYGMLPSREDSVLMIGFFEQCFVQRLDSVLTGGRWTRPSSVVYPSQYNSRSEWCVRQQDVR